MSSPDEYTEPSPVRSGEGDDLEPAELWDRHGTAVWSLACALLGNQPAALRAVALGMVDLYLPADGEAERDVERDLRTAALFTYLRCEEMLSEAAVVRTMSLPPVIARLGELARLQRTCLALCVFGGHTYRQAADVLEVPPETVAGLLTSGLHELGRTGAVGPL